MEPRAEGKKWWRDQFARLVITIVGGVVAALIVTIVVPALLEGNNASDAPTQQDEPADAPAEPAPSSEPGTEEEPAATESTEPPAEDQ